MDRTSALVVELYGEMGEGAAVDTRHMAQWFRRQWLPIELRQEVLAGFHRMVRLQRRLDYLLAGAADVRGRERATARHLTAELIEGRRSAEEVEREDVAVDWARVLRNDADLAAEPDPVRRLALLHSLPDGIARRLVEQYGAEADALAGSLATPPPATIRANLLLGDRDDLSARLRQEGVATRPTEFADQGLVVITAINTFKTQAFQEGRFEVQDEGSQLVATVTAPPPGSTIVDSCAGSGGKTLALASLLRGKGHVLALDVAEHRLQELRLRARRAQAGNVRAMQVEEQRWGEAALATARKAARILVDAPCSGTGAWRRHPEARWRVGEDVLQRLVATQQSLLNAALAALKSGARAVYATCSLLREENEAIVDAALEADPSLALMPIKEILGSDVARGIADPTGTYLKVLPHRHGTDGFFAAVLRRK